MAELLVRPGLNDHKVIQDLLSPGGSAVLLPGSRPLADRIVVEAHIAGARPEFADAAKGAGAALMIDPLTPYWQGELREKDRWSQLPFGTPEKLDALDFYGSALDRRVDEVVSFQIEQGATAIIPPYPYAQSPNDAFFDLSLEMLRCTARYMRHNGVSLPVVPILCAQLKGFANERRWRYGIERFMNTALDLGPQAVGLCLSPTGSGSDSYAKVLRLFTTALHAKRSGARVLAWRQGIYGPALVAAGLDGYETGVGTREQCNVARSIASRKPPKPGKKPGGGGAPGIYIEPLRRSVSPRVGETLLGNRALRPKVMCDDERCCPDGAASTLDQRRQHAIRSRARELGQLEAQPHSTWRMHQAAKDARNAAALGVQANRVLGESGIPERIPVTSAEALANVLDHLRAPESDVDVA